MNEKIDIHNNLKEDLSGNRHNFKLKASERILAGFLYSIILSLVYVIGGFEGAVIVALIGIWINTLD